MATSGSYDNITTMSTILSDAYNLIGVIDDGEPLPAEMESYGKRQLNKLMSLLSTHKGMWLVDDVTITLTPGTTSYTMGVGETVNTPRPMSISAVRRYVSSSLEIPMKVEPRSGYMGLPNKSLQAPPLLVYYDQRRDTGELYVWPTGTNTEKTIIVTAQRPIQDFDSEGNNPDLPKGWILAIEYTLASLIAPKYLGGVVPPDIKQTASDLLATIVGYDEEKTSLIFGPGK